MLTMDEVDLISTKEFHLLAELEEGRILSLIEVRCVYLRWKITEMNMRGKDFSLPKFIEEMTYRCGI